MTTYNLDVGGIEEILQDFDPRLLEQSVVGTLNKLGTRSRTEIVRLVRQTYNVKAGDVRKAVEIRRARRGSAVVDLLSIGRRIPLVAFGARQRRRGVSVRVKKSGGTKIIPNTFIAVMPTGHRGVFERVGRKRLPITELFGPAIPQMVKNRENINKVVEKISRDAPVIMRQEINFRVLRSQGRA